MAYIIVTCGVCGIENASAKKRIEEFIVQLRNERWTVSDSGKIATCPQCKGLRVSERKIVYLPNYVVARSDTEARELAENDSGFDTLSTARSYLKERTTEDYAIYAVNVQVKRLDSDT